MEELKDTEMVIDTSSNVVNLDTEDAKLPVPIEEDKTPPVVRPKVIYVNEGDKDWHEHLKVNEVYQKDWLQRFKLSFPSEEDAIKYLKLLIEN
jgi:hypothetical protein